MKNNFEFSRQPRFFPEMPTGEIEIINPPSVHEKPEISWLAILLPPSVMLILTVLFALSSQSLYMLISAVTTVMTVIGSVTTATRQISKYKKYKVTREQQFLQHIADLRAELTLSREQQVAGLNEMHPSPEACLERINATDNRLWEKTPAHEDFLAVRLGMGSVQSAVKVSYTKQQMNLDNDPLAEEPKKLALEFERVKGAPVCVNLFSTEVCGVAGEEAKVLELLRLIVLQIVTHHGYDDVRLVLLLKDTSLANWNWVRHLPHLWDDQYQTRFLICGRAIAHQTLGELYEVFKGRELRANSSDRGENYLPHYVFVVEDSSLLENEVINKYLYKENGKLGVSSVFVASNKAYLPMNCKTVITLQSGTGELANRQTGEKSSFVQDKVEYKDIERAAGRLAPLKIKSSSVSFALPRSITLTEMLNVHKVEEVDLLSRWQKHKTYRGMSVPIGARAGGELFNLDLHETGFGPHGLVAGTTGSGKSELLQSIIIALAINFHPHDVVFVLIDYKGGGMADVFQGMPHLVGTITNLGGNQTVRALVSIKSELQRRQRIFSEHGVNNIDKYQKLYHQGGAKEPLPHLIMIADEFAELKAEQPDFMKELVSTARVGRSLGIHLILATQKPGGVVDDQIWSNSRFKICLKVQDERDSKDVIKRPDAAMIKEPGRAYIQVGNDEVFEMFQSAYAGADYYPEGAQQQSKQQTKRIYKVQLNGKTEQIYPIDEEKIIENEAPSQLAAMVAYIRHQAEGNGITALKGPWLPPLPETIYLENLYPASETGFNYETGTWQGNPPLLKPLVGFVDDPRAQLQEPLAFDFAADGHMFVYGAPGTGKTFFLETICLSLAHLYSPSEVNIYLMDFGGTALKQFSRLPHCGGVMTIEQEGKINQFMRFIFRLIDERKRRFEEYRVDNFIAYKARVQQELPAVFIMVDNYFALSETYDLVNEQMMLLAREGSKFGIFLIATATNSTMVRYKFAVNFKMAVSFQLTDKGEYSTIVGRNEGLEPAPLAGRALVRNKPPLEFQTALPEFRGKSTEELIEIYAAFADAGKFKRAQPIPEMPSVIDIDEINKLAYGSSIVIGLNDHELQPVVLDLSTTPIVMVAGEPQTGKSTLLASWLEVLLNRLGEDIRVYAKDSSTMGIFRILESAQVTDLNEITDIDALTEELKMLVEGRRDQLNDYRRNKKDVQELYNSWQQIVFVFDNLSEFTDNADYSFKDFLELIAKKGSGLKIALLAGGNTNELGSNYDSFAKAVREAQCGLMLGSLKDQNLYNARIPYGAYEKEFAVGDGYFIVKNKFVGLRTAYQLNV